MKKIFEKNETLFSILLIVLYLVVNSICLNNFGMTDYRTALTNSIFSIGLIILIIYLKRVKYYGITRAENSKRFLYFLPLLLILSVNLWNGININNTRREILFHIINMINVGFIEEIIFRGFLFKMMARDNVKSAIIVSSITFGVGHIINLFTGADVLMTLLQVGYATSIGYLFTIIFYKSKSLIPCIVTHSIMNSLSIFNSSSSLVSGIFLIIVPLIYAFYINYKDKEDVKC